MEARRLNEQIVSSNERFFCKEGAKYWLKKLNQIIQKIKQDKNMNYSDILSSLSKKIVALQENDNLIIYDGCECQSASLWKNEKAREAILKKL